jgi:hypothetical protein
MNPSLPYLNFTANCFHSRNSDLRNHGAGSVKKAYGSGTIVYQKKKILFCTANVMTRQIFGKRLDPNPSQQIRVKITARWNYDNSVNYCPLYL